MVTTASLLQTLPSLAETVASLRAQKRLGQNFLTDEGLCDHIVRAIPEGVNVLEIGPGPGGLTRALLLAGHRVTAVELDLRMIETLRPLEKLSEARLTLKQADARRIKVDQPTFIAGNLPFHVATELWLGWLKAPHHILGMVLMFQAEVAERLLAQPFEKAYGRLSILSQYLWDIEPWLEVPAHCFIPPPKVDGAVIRATPKADITARLDNIAALDALIRHAFAKRRKLLRANLKPLCADPAEVLQRVGIAGGARAEELSIDDFLRLMEAIKKEP